MASYQLPQRLLLETSLQQSKFSDSPSLYEYLMLTKHLPMLSHVISCLRILLHHPNQKINYSQYIEQQN
ncbi:hypothetical protein HanIR_Chr03g0148801 [Helianthus annuus]|nr:hypothetical protein HanIR_Chr03g0148801 [Helianthus annuus]